MGTMVSKNTANSPNGLINTALAQWPCKTDNTERDVPHEGQGIPVTCLNKQIEILASNVFSVTNNQIYPANVKIISSA